MCREREHISLFLERRSCSLYEQWLDLTVKSTRQAKTPLRNCLIQPRCPGINSNVLAYIDTVSTYCPEGKPVKQYNCEYV